MIGTVVLMNFDIGFSLLGVRSQLCRNPSKTHFPVWVKMRSVMRTDRYIVLRLQAVDVQQHRVRLLLPIWSLHARIAAECIAHVTR